MRALMIRHKWVWVPKTPYEQCHCGAQRHTGWGRPHYTDAGGNSTGRLRPPCIKETKFSRSVCSYIQSELGNA
jgi:hypothetical protein